MLYLKVHLFKIINIKDTYTRIRTDNTKQSIKPDTGKYTSQQK